MVKKMDFMTIKIPTQYLGKVSFVMNRYRIPYEIVDDSDNDLIKEALKSPVLDSLVKGIMKSVNDDDDDDYIDIDSEDVEEKEEDFPPKYKRRNSSDEEKEE